MLAELNLVYVEDATKAKVILTKYTTHIDSLGGPRGGRGGRGGRGSGGRHDSGRGRGGGNASSRRATSNERAFPTPPPPLPIAPPPPIQQPGPPPPGQSTSQYSDNELSSNSDDDEDFIQNYGNLVDGSGAPIPNSYSNLNTSSNIYSPSTTSYFLPFGGVGTINRTKLKWQRKLSNRLVRKREASARRAASQPPTIQDLIAPDDSSISSSVTSSIGSFAAAKLNSPEACVSHPSLTTMNAVQIQVRQMSCSQTMRHSYLTTNAITVTPFLEMTPNCPF